MKDRIQILVISSIISFLLLVSFLVMQYYDFKVLKLDIKWLFVSGLPVLIGLFLSGLIKSFKGFGVELETNLSEEIDINLIGSVESYPTPEITKSTLQTLHSLPAKEKLKIERLQFIYGEKDYYDHYVVMEYFNNLQKLRYIEIIDEDGKFFGLLSAGKFKQNRDERIYRQRDERIDLLIESIENKTIQYNFKELITDTINKSDSLIEAYKKFKDSNQGKLRFGDQVLPVIDSNYKMIGLTRRFKLADKISEQVIKVNI